VTHPAIEPSSNLRKYESGNRVLQALIRRFHARMLDLVAPLGAKRVLDVGCGEGFFARALLDRFPGVELVGVDASEAAIAHASARCPEARFEVSRIEALRARGRFDLVVCSEVLEHLEDPAAGIANLADCTAGHALLTVPWEPWFQLANLARGKYLATLGNHPEHVQRWTRAGFERAVSGRFARVHSESMFPWTLFLGTPREP